MKKMLPILFLCLMTSGFIFSRAENYYLSEGRRVIFRDVVDNTNQYNLDEANYFDHQSYRLNLQTLENLSLNTYFSEDYLVQLTNRKIERKNGATVFKAELDSAGVKSQLILVYDHQNLSGVIFSNDKSYFLTGAINSTIQKSRIKSQVFNDPQESMNKQNSIPAPLIFMIYQSLEKKKRSIFND